MIVRGEIKKGSYYDSITLMRVGKAVAALDGVTDAADYVAWRRASGSPEARPRRACCGTPAPSAGRTGGNR